MHASLSSGCLYKLLVNSRTVIFVTMSYRAPNHSGKESQPFFNQANSLPGAKVPIGPWPICSLELSLPGTFVPWTFCGY